MNAQPTTKDAYRLLHQGTFALAQMERNGLCVDVEYCTSMANHLKRQLVRLETQFKRSDLVQQWRKRYGQSTNLNSPQQLSELLYTHMNIEPVKFTDGECPKCGGQGCKRCWGSGFNPSVDEEALEAINVDEIQDLLRIRRLSKVRDTYLLSFLREQVDGVVHPMFNLNIAKSFRPSTEAPNLANVPKRDPEAQKICRQAIIPRKGHKILSADFKGVEVVVAACYHKDPIMIEYVSDKSKDMHRDMAERLFMIDMHKLEKESKDAYKALRHSGKNEWVFPQFYGDWYKSCAGYMWPSAHKETHRLPDGRLLVDYLKDKGLKTLAQFEEHCKQVEDWMWNEKWPVYTQWKKDWVKQYHHDGFFDSLTGFRYSGVMDRKQVINYPVQGSAFHCLLQCLIWMVEDGLREGWKSHACNQIYDDLMMDVHPDEEQMIVDRLQYYMTDRLPKHWPWIIVPLEVEIEATPIDGSWYEKSTKWLLAA